jgi:SAM-dependent methyltransferase
MNNIDQADYDFLLAQARADKFLAPVHYVHLDQPIGVLNYLRIANDIAQQIQPCRLLDWGCGYGQMTYLLQRRNFQVTAFDVVESDNTTWHNSALYRNLEVIRGSHPTALPFTDKSFDAVLSCGVLEHVDEGSQSGNEIKSLREIARILRPGGTLLIYQLPQKLAWQEALARKLKLGYTHPRRYTSSEISRILSENGYTVRRLRRANLIPKNLTGIPSVLRDIYSRLGKLLIAADRALCFIPGLNQFAGVLEITAQRTL